MYVDGFNLYYGALKNTPFKWLDLLSLCQRLLPGHDIDRIRYFTARVTPRPPDLDQHVRQQTYLRALESIPNLTIHYGSFMAKTKTRPLASPVAGLPRFVTVMDTEEKGSDVNLATYLLRDGFKGEYESAVVVTNDSDLLHPIEIVRTELDLPVGVLNPHRHPSRALLPVATFYKPIRKGVLAACQFPTTLIVDGHEVTKPKGW